MIGELCAPAVEADQDGDDAVEIQDEFRREPCGVEPLEIAPSPTRPSPADVEEHRITHTPFRSWCEECVSGRALGEQRGHHAGRSHEIAIVGLDYFYVTEKGLVKKDELQYPDDEAIKDARMKNEIVKCLIIRCYESKNVFAHVVPVKGDDEDRFAAGVAVNDVAWLGHVKLILKSDQEPALVSLVSGALKVLKHTVEDLASVSTEHSQRYDSQASGGTEVGVRNVRGLFRTMGLCIGTRVGR